MENSYLIDTNILVYAYNENVEYHKKSLKIVEDMLNRQMNAVIADKTLFEFFAIITDPKRVEKPVTIKEACEIIDFLVNSKIKIVYTTQSIVTKTLELVKRYSIKRQDIFDAVLVALMIQNKISTVITANEKHFKDFEEIKVLNPFL